MNNKWYKRAVFLLLTMIIFGAFAAQYSLDTFLKTGNNKNSDRILSQIYDAISIYVDESTADTVVIYSRVKSGSGDVIIIKETFIDYGVTELITTEYTHDTWDNRFTASYSYLYDN